VVGLSLAGVLAGEAAAKGAAGSALIDSVPDYLVYQSGGVVFADALTPGLSNYSGSSSDAALIVQQGVNALRAAAGGLIVFKGALTFASQLVVYPNVGFMGAAPFGYKNAATPYGPVVTSTYNGSAIVLTGDSRGSTFPYLGNFVLVGSHSLTRQNGIEFNTSGGTLRDVFIDNVFVDNMGQHGWVIGGSSIKIHAYRCYIEICGGNGIDGSSSTGGNQLELTDSYIEGNTGFGFVTPANSFEWTISGGRFSTNAAGAISVAYTTTSAIIDGVFFDGNGGSSAPQIVIPSANFASARVNISGCDFNNSSVTNHILLGSSNTVYASIADCSFYGSSGDAISWTSRAGSRILIDNCLGYTDVRGKITNPFSAGGRIGAAGTSASPSASTTYQVEGTRLMVSASGGTRVSITIADSSGNTIASGLSSYVGLLPHQFSINFGAFSVAPTVVAAVA
jgi:hypothetical protein